MPMMAPAQGRGNPNNFGSGAGSWVFSFANVSSMLFFIYQADIEPIGL
jgi:hypothetical protein